MKKENVAWVDYTKITASILIMMAHLQNAALDLCAAPPVDSSVFNLFRSVMVPLQTGKIWVMIFCIVSGYFGNKRIASLKDMCVECGYRYLRFAVPLFLCNLLILCLSRFGLFFHLAYGALYDSQWLLTNYAAPYRIADLIKDTLSLGNVPSSPVWTIHLLFLGNLVILGVNYITCRMSRRNRLLVQWLTLGALAVVSFRFQSAVYLAATFSGLLFSEMKQTVISPKLIPVLVLPAFMVYYLPLFGSFAWVNSLRNYWVTGLIYTFAFVFSGYRGKSVKAVNLSSVSFWVYVLHWPFLCSLGLWLLLVLPFSFWPSYVLASIALFVSVVSVSILLSKTFDVWLNRSLKQMKQKLLAK